MKHLFSLIFILLFSTQLNAQNDSAHIKVSLLTCGVGEQLYATFGHSALRIVDSAKGMDAVYNYGLFDFYDPDFLYKFTKGKLLYFVGRSSYFGFLEEYRIDGRSVVEQDLSLNQTQAQAIVDYLNENLKPENRSYKYDFLFDNCATRIRDIFPKTIGPGFAFGQVFDSGQSFTFRQILNEYLKNNHWPRLGINIILGSRIDKVMSNEQAMFLPDLLMKAIAGASIEHRPILAKEIKVLPSLNRNSASLNGPLWLMIGVLVLTMLVIFFAPMRKFKSLWAFVLLFISGALGLFLLFAWLGTDHQTFAYNYNILWALPFNFLVAFSVFRPRRWHKNYSLFAIILLMASLLLHILGIQVMPLKELLPFLISLLYIYLFLYKRAIALKAK